MRYIKRAIKPVKLSRLQSVLEQNWMGGFIGNDATVSINRSIQFLALVCLLNVILVGCSGSPATVGPSNVSTLTSTTG